MIDEQSFLNASIDTRIDLTDALSIIYIRPDAGATPKFEAGQFVTIGLLKPIPAATDAGGAPVEPITQAAHLLSPVRDSGVAPLPRPARPRTRPPMIKRAYSIASSPLESDRLELFVVRVDEGRLTPLLWQLPIGGRLWMDEACKGEFTLEHVLPARHLIMIATGTGIAPFVSMLRTYPSGQRWRRATLIHGVRFACDLGYREELAALAGRDPTFRYVPLVSRGEAPEREAAAATSKPVLPPYLVGRVQVAMQPAAFEGLTGEALSPQTCSVMLCGNPAMIDSITADLTQLGFQIHARNNPGNVHFERYW